MKKPDFDRFLLQSTFLPEEEKRSYTGNFSYSAGRYSLFRFCKRAWFFHYIAAQGGWNEYTKDFCQEIYTQKYLVSFPAFLSNILTSSIRESLPLIREEEKEDKRLSILRDAIRFRASAIIFHAHHFLRNGGMDSDPRRLAFFDLYYRTGKFENGEELIENCKDILRNFLPQFFQSSFFRVLALLPAPAWRYGENFPSFILDGLTIFLPPSLYALSGGCLYRFAVSFFEEYKESFSSSSDALFALYTESKYPGHKGKKVFLHYSEKENILTEEVTYPTAEEKELIFSRAEEMVKYLQDPQISFFPCTEEKEKCIFCRFRKNCKNPE